MSKRPLAVELGEFVAALRFQDLPAEVVDKSKAIVNHAITVAMAGYSTPNPAAARKAVLLEETLGGQRIGPGEGATLWVDGSRVTRAGAAFANALAITSNSLFDSYHMLCHPNIATLPAGFATAEGEGRTGKELLTAIVAAYEVQCRCARDFLPTTAAHGFHGSVVYGILGSATITAKLLGLNASQAAHAIALAASFAGTGIIESARTGIRDDYAKGVAARNGIWAARLASQGFQGAPTALEGEAGFYYAFTGSNRGDLTYAFTGPLKADLNDIVSELGQRWEVMDVKFKVYPTPGFNNPVIWLAREMVKRHRLMFDEIEHITLEMNHLETVYPSPRFPRPFGRAAYMLAYTIVTGDYPVLGKNVEQVNDAGPSTAPGVTEKIEALQNRIEIIGEIGRNIFAPRLTITLRDGRRFVGEYNGRELMWDFNRGAQELRRLVPGLPIAPEQYDRLVAVISGLEKANSVDELIRLTLPKE